jgi:hypothetical protein
LYARILQEPLQADRMVESDFLQFLHRTHRRRNGQHIAAYHEQPAFQFLQSRCFARAGRSADSDCSISRLKHKFDSLLLLGPQVIGYQERLTSPKNVECPYAPIDGVDHLTFSGQAF